MKINPSFIRLLTAVSLSIFWLYSFAQDERIAVRILNCSEMPAIYSALPDKVSETSGLIYFENDIWTFNDSGGEPEVYKIDKNTGEIVQTLVFKHAENVDWEDITQDETYVYTGDFGNNFGNRKDLAIYRIRKDAITDVKKLAITAEKISFRYEDQTSFDIKNRNHDFDCESMISMGDSLILFTKDWVDGKSRLYRLPKTPGDYVVAPQAVFEAGGLVTGASLNTGSGRLALIGYRDYVPFIWLVGMFNGYSFTSDDVVRINLNSMKNTQTEGISWLDDSTLIISSEQTKKFPQAAYQINIPQFIKQCKPADDE